MLSSSSISASSSPSPASLNSEEFDRGSDSTLSPSVKTCKLNCRLRPFLPPPHDLLVDHHPYFLCAVGFTIIVININSSSFIDIVLIMLLPQ